MNESFDLDNTALAADPHFAELAHLLAAQPRIDSEASFNQYCRSACMLWAAQAGQGIGKTSAKWTEQLGRIKRGGDGVIPTSWGGVVVTRHEPPEIEKYLVIRRGKYLALEKHDEKDEHLEVQEGAGLVLFRRTAAASLVVQVLMPGGQFHFRPGQEHCLIGTENLLVFEHSTDPKGMDQDLIFLYEPEDTMSKKL